MASVRLMTYNHEAYIKEAMDGIMKQKINFRIEVVVGNDFSSDNTLGILRQYHDTNNIKIKILERQMNDTYWNKRQKLGRIYNFTNIIANCSGKYIALLDGDDYWTDENKLQKQVDFLEANEEYVICFHKVKILQDQILVDDFITKVPGETTTITDLANGNYIYPLSAVVRNIMQNGFPKWFYECGVGDFPLFMLLAKHGKLKYMDDFMGVYRLNNSGLWFSKSNLHKAREWHRTLVFLSADMDGEVRETLQRSIIDIYGNLDDEYRKEMDLHLATQNKLKWAFNFRISFLFRKASHLIKKIFH